jgi:hypothetical protein
MALVCRAIASESRCWQTALPPITRWFNMAGGGAVHNSH